MSKRNVKLYNNKRVEMELLTADNYYLNLILQRNK